MAKRTVQRAKNKPKAALADYEAKRDFSKTREPRPASRRTAKTQKLAFVVQKHAARRLHYDLRLELDGVLKSWAVTRGPSLAAGEKRLAVEVEDHPLAYADFEGTIPPGEYGGGEVIVWDHGQWLSEGDPHRGLAKGHLEFELRGQKLKGRWHLVRMRARRNETKPQWLLIKADDTAARSGQEAEITATAPLSVKTGRAIEALRNAEPRKAQARATQASRRHKKANLPPFIEPCLASLVDKTPEASGYIHEIKFDGYRLQIRCDGKSIQYLSRSGLDYTEKIVPSPLHDAVMALGLQGTILDGELVVEGPGGVTDFSALQTALKKGDRSALVYMAFDCLFRDNRDMRERPLAERKTLLRDMMRQPDTAPFRFSDAIATGGAALLAHACRLGLEGIVSKKSDAPYRSGRGSDWVKSKCVTREDFVIAGFTPSTAMKRAVGALVLGAYQGDRLMPAGRAGSGFTVENARQLYDTLSAMRRDASPFVTKPDASWVRQAIWTEPRLVADIAFRGVTPDGALRHPVFKGLRDDKDAHAVKLTQEMTAVTRAKTVETSHVKLTHPERIVWPDAGITKQGLLDYYEAVFPWMKAYITDRPLSVIRCPEGVGEHCFFQKHEWAGLSDAVRRVRDPVSDDEWLVIDDLQGLAAFAQAGVLEIHPWGSLIGMIEKPDLIIFDLDPGDGVLWPAMVAAAREIRDRLSAMKLTSFVKTSGGKGLHVVVPLKPKAEWPDVKAWTHDFAHAMAADSPQSYVATIKKSARKGKILIDYLRNGRGATAVAAYSPRARPGAPVSMPVAWDELDEIAPAQFHMGNSIARLTHQGRDPWEGLFKLKQLLPPLSQPKIAKTGTRRKAAR